MIIKEWRREKWRTQPFFESSRVESSRAGLRARGASAGNAELRAWLEYVASTAIDWLDQLDAEGEDREDDEIEAAP